MERVYRHGGARGDLIYGLSVMERLGPGTLRLGGRWGGVLRRLCEAQPYVTGFEIRPDWRGVTDDLDAYRERPVNYFWTPLPVMMQMAAGIPIDGDWARPWLTGPERDGDGPPIVCRSGRYWSRTMSWAAEVDYLRQTYGEPIFLGVPSEHAAFEKQWKTGIEHVPTGDLWDVAQHMVRAPMISCNQSCPLAMTHGLGLPVRIERATGYFVTCITGRENETLLNYV